MRFRNEEVIPGWYRSKWAKYNMVKWNPEKIELWVNKVGCFRADLLSTYEILLGYMATGVKGRIWGKFVAAPTIINQSW